MVRVFVGKGIPHDENASVRRGRRRLLRGRGPARRERGPVSRGRSRVFCGRGLARRERGPVSRGTARAGGRRAAPRHERTLPRRGRGLVRRRPAPPRVEHGLPRRGRESVPDGPRRSHDGERPSSVKRFARPEPYLAHRAGPCDRRRDEPDARRPTAIRFRGPGSQARHMRRLRSRKENTDGCEKEVGQEVQQRREREGR
jgi:hypothetical protein